MSQKTTPRTAACAANASLLPLAGHHLLSADEDATLREHLATCADCRAELALYTCVEAAWRHTFATDQASEPIVSREVLLADIRNEPVAITARSARRAAAASPPSLPTATRSRLRRVVAGVSALAAALLIAISVGAAFLAHVHTAGSVGTQATATAKAASYQNISDSQFIDISMVSDTEGWAVGGTYIAIYNHTSDPGMLYEKPLLWHYLNGTWSPVQLSIHGQLKSISMDSATDGWAIGLDAYEPTGAHLLLLHYDGHAWKQVPSQGIQADMLSQVLMLSPTNGWIVGTPLPTGFPPPSGQSPQESGIWHYDGKSWKAAPLPADLNEPLQQGDQLQVFSISMISSTEGWATATLQATEQIPPSPTPVTLPSSDAISPIGVILHYTGGRWAVQQFMPKTFLQAVSMLSATNGWIGGQTDTRTITADPNFPGGVTQDKTAPLLLHYVQSHWENVTSSVNANPNSIEDFLKLSMRSATDGWAVFLPVSLSRDTPALFHYDGSQWNSVQLPTTRNTSIYYLTGVSITSPTEGWAVGSREVKTSSVYTYQRVPVLYRLHNGVWSVVQS